VTPEVFHDTPHIELLQWLARGSLKQNLLRAIRLWVWLNSLYGSEKTKLDLPSEWTYADWRNVFFTTSHPKGDEIPILHDKNCRCAKNVAQWLFTKDTGINKNDWIKAIKSHYFHQIQHNKDYRKIKDSPKELLIIDPQDKPNKKTLEQILNLYLFQVTRRTLQRDLEILAELGWLKYDGQKYHRVTEFPSRPLSIIQETASAKFNTDKLSVLNQEDVTAIAENHSQLINGVQRFFLHLDYVVPRETIDLVEDCQNELKQLWEKTPVPPVKLTYNSARVADEIDCIVYPVCIYYMQRAVYLCACGESPNRETDWYNFRLDRIQDMTALEWSDSQIPQHLQKFYQKASLPSPDYIAVEMSKAWGFDFYLPSRLMLIRFDRDYNDRYIKNTFRHETFIPITYQQAQRLVTREAAPSYQQALLNVLKNRSSEDAYYQVNYRHRDNGITMRLRAWRPMCEVLLPFDLRQSIANDVTEEFKLYCGE
jgi:CRISPR-associated protein (TIGR03985 family)